VVIPALNEGNCVAETVQRWHDGGVAIIRVIDNGSSDDTTARAGAAGAAVLQEPRRGYGAAAWTGLQDLPPAIEWVIFSAADGSDRLSEAEAHEFQEAINQGAEFILGERVTLAVSRHCLTPAQRFGNALGCELIALGWRHRYRDMASVRVVRRTALAAMKLQDRSFGWNVEMQVRAVELGLHIAEIPVTHHPRSAGTSKISGNFRGVVRAGWSMLATLGHLFASRASRQNPSTRRNNHDTA